MLFFKILLETGQNLTVGAGFREILTSFPILNASRARLSIDLRWLYPAMSFLPGPGFYISGMQLSGNE
jgi:hypothetical protein